MLFVFVTFFLLFCLNSHNTWAQYGCLLTLNLLNIYLNVLITQNIYSIKMFNPSPNICPFFQCLCHLYKDHYNAPVTHSALLHVLLVAGRSMTQKITDMQTNTFCANVIERGRKWALGPSLSSCCLTLLKSRYLPVIYKQWWNHYGSYMLLIRRS